MRTRRFSRAVAVLMLLVMASGVLLAFSRWMARAAADDYMSPRRDVLRYFHISLIPTFSTKGPYHLPFWNVTYIRTDVPALCDPLPFVHVSLSGKVIDAQPGICSQHIDNR